MCATYAAHLMHFNFIVSLCYCWPVPACLPEVSSRAIIHEKRKIRNIFILNRPILLLSTVFCFQSLSLHLFSYKLTTSLHFQSILQLIKKRSSECQQLRMINFILPNIIQPCQIISRNVEMSLTNMGTEPNTELSISYLIQAIFRLQTRGAQHPRPVYV